MGDLGRPFRGGEALAAGTVTRRELARDYRPIFVGVYLHREIDLTPLLKAEAAWLWSGRRGTVAGLSAAAVHRSKWIDAGDPAELLHTNGRGTPGLIVHQGRFRPDERAAHGRLPVTTVPRTIVDLARTRKVDDAVRRIDALLNARARRQQVHAVAAPILHDARTILARYPGHRGTARARRVLDLVDAGAESPPETSTRLCLIRAGLPRPRTQFAVHTECGPTEVAWIDMAYPAELVAVEYDGADHWLDPGVRAHDIDRYEALEDLHWRIIRVGADLLRDRKPEIVDRVRRALAGRR